MITPPKMNVLATTIGSLLRRLPTTPVRLGVAVLFVVGGILLLRGGGDDAEEGEEERGAVSFRTAMFTAASVVGLAEFGDLTQLATAGIAARYDSAVAVAVDAAAGRPLISMDRSMLPVTR